MPGCPGLHLSGDVLSDVLAAEGDPYALLVLDESATLPPQGLSPAQAIHLASALAVKRDLTAFVSYDQHLLAAARDAGLPVASPGSA